MTLSGLNTFRKVKFVDQCYQMTPLAEAFNTLITYIAFLSSVNGHMSYQNILLTEILITLVT